MSRGTTRLAATAAGGTGGTWRARTGAEIVDAVLERPDVRLALAVASGGRFVAREALDLAELLAARAAEEERTG
jgi:hypothetical protein